MFVNRMKGVDRIIYGNTTKKPLTTTDNIERAVEFVASEARNMLDRYEGELSIMA